MEKLRVFVRNFNEKKVYRIVFFVVSMLCIIGMYILIREDIEWNKHTLQIQTGEVVFDKNVYFDIETCKREGENSIISGWVIKADANIEKVYVIFKEANSNKIYREKQKGRKEIANYFLQDESEDAYGFELRIDDELDNASCYEILLYLCLTEKDEAEQRTGKAVWTEQIKTGKYIYQQKIYNYNPKEFYAPHLEGAYAKVVQDGIVRAYDIDKQYWVYQYQAQLFYFAGRELVDVNKDKQLSVPVMPSTSISELLPEGRRQYGGDHLGAFSLDNIYTNTLGESFYIQVVNLPKDYPITYMSTGIYNNMDQMWITHSFIPMFDWRIYKK